MALRVRLSTLQCARMHAGNLLQQRILHVQQPPRQNRMAHVFLSLTQLPPPIQNTADRDTRRCVCACVGHCKFLPPVYTWRRCLCCHSSGSFSMDQNSIVVKCNCPERFFLVYVSILCHHYSIWRLAHRSSLGMDGTTGSGPLECEIEGVSSNAITVFESLRIFLPCDMHCVLMSLLICCCNSWIDWVESIGIGICSISHM